jgi:hypothetical protein
MLPDEARGAGQRDKGLMWRSRGRRRRSSIPARTQGRFRALSLLPTFARKL